MTMDIREGDCFGFYGKEVICEGCPAMKRCKAVLMTDGFGIIDGLISELLERLPKGQKIVDSDKVSELVMQMMEGGSIPDQEVKQILTGMMDYKSIDLSSL